MKDGKQKRTILEGSNGPTIITSNLVGNQVVIEVMAVDQYKGRNVSIGLTPDAVDTIIRHHKDLKRLYRSEVARATAQLRKQVNQGKGA